MTPTDPMQGNEIIAEFIQYIDGIGFVNKYPYTPNNLRFHKDWQWLMPVVEKIKILSNDWPKLTECVWSLPITTPIDEVYKNVLLVINDLNSITSNGTTNE